MSEESNNWRIYLTEEEAMTEASIQMKIDALKAESEALQAKRMILVNRAHQRMHRKKKSIDTTSSL